MAQGKLIDGNLTALATLSGGAWSGSWPLNNLKDESNYVGAPARCTDCTSLANSQFEILLPEPRLVSVMALLFHTMSLGALYRVKASSEDSTQNYVANSNALVHNTTWQMYSVATGFASDWWGYVENDPAVVAPDGAVSALKVVPLATSGASAGLVLRNNAMAAVTLGQPYKPSWWVYYPAGPALTFAVNNDLNAGVAFNVLPSPLWQRIPFSTFTKTGGASFYDLEVVLYPSGAVPTNPAYPFWVWGPQLEPGSAMTSYYPNPAGLAASTRPAGYMDSWQTYDLNTDWQYVFPSIFDPLDLEFGVENFITGTVASAEIDLIKRHRPIIFPEVLARRIRIELDDRANPAGFFDVGGCWVGGGFSPAVNFERGRDLSVMPRDVVDEAPSGRLFAEERDPRRKLEISYQMLTDPEMRRFVDAGLRARTTRTVLFLPDTDDEAQLIREFFPAVFEQPPGGKLFYPGLNSTALTLKEILA